MNRRKMESGTEGEIGSPRGFSPEGRVGVDSGRRAIGAVAHIAASALYLRGNLHAGWGVQLGGTETPA
jgi:hypothetical protein